jgi:hypothetical protein
LTIQSHPRGFQPCRTGNFFGLTRLVPYFREFRVNALTGIGNTLTIAFRGDDDHRACKPRHDFGEDVST